ncbi:transporter substrate-binding domain-containing protein [Salinarimonas soli]|uniref:Transporter substrate-binding domain-containing protein n=1 Tax=Salinarimonas soli TaxID=1638099 RepID=A0A5B2V7Z3_9HYPH|nr:transporter substrate-binding domain-containing protein [Salinarimonas soli]KAA2234580.1 transporter substrate-binding domain-containing protein [Salinarimonas soli]
MRARPEIGPVPQEIVRRLSPSGVLRAGINLSNFLLVSSRNPDGSPAGVSPDLARALADTLGLELRYVTYPSPGPLADAAAHDEWDVALVGAEPQRAETIAFTPAYAEIEATYLVPKGSGLHAIEDVDAPGVRIAVTDRTAYGLWLERNIRSASLVGTASFDDALSALVEGRADALAGLRSRLVSDQDAHPNTRILEGRFMAVQQAIGVPRAKAEILPYLEQYVAAARGSGFIADLIRHHGVEGLSVAGS